MILFQRLNSFLAFSLIYFLGGIRFSNEKYIQTTNLSLKMVNYRTKTQLNSNRLNRTHLALISLELDAAKKIRKELSLCHKLKFYSSYIYATWWCKSLIFQTWIIWCIGINSLKYLRSATTGCKDIEVSKSELVQQRLNSLLKYPDLRRSVFTSESGTGSSSMNLCSLRARDIILNTSDIS